MKTRNEIILILKEKGLKVTPQRISILSAVYKLGNHPGAEKVIESIREEFPNIASGTIYKVLDTFVNNGILHKVKTEAGIMRYDSEPETHHHLYCSESDRIEDYFDKELDGILKNYFANKNIPNFSIEDVKLQIKGRFQKRKSKK